ncbi:TraR/DksA family transcriptional regulator [Actinospongicola halichondriae]|uniref:TraR/DksA family transcriptional regulator n=1 Tax=Actinospongicola halichondriae TaxID=3236844 RepID=UPI003D39488C
MQSFIDHRFDDSEREGGGPDGRGLSSGQLEELRAVLDDRLDDHRKRLAENESLFRALMGDSSVDAGTRQSARIDAERDLDAVQETVRALDAMVDGTYGVCRGCNRAIPFERLEVLPTTQTCVACPDH